MTQLKHTPGPFRAEQAVGLYGSKVSFIAQVFSLGRKIASAYGKTAEEANANARLVAAAPDMFAIFENIVKTGAMLEREGIQADYAYEFRQVVFAARAAIAKAKGAQS